MSAYEYKAIPAPTRGEKAKGVKTPADRFAHAVTAEINRMAAEGWNYIRAETLPAEERSGLTGRNTVYHNLLIFRRELPDTALSPRDVPAPAATVQPLPETAPAPATRATADPAPAPVSARKAETPQPRPTAEPPVKSPTNPLSALRPHTDDAPKTE